MKFIIDRLREPSTFAGIAAFLAGFGLLGFTESDWNQVFGAVAAIAGAAAVFLKEGDGGDATDSLWHGARYLLVLPDRLVPYLLVCEEILKIFWCVCYYY